MVCLACEMELALEMPTERRKVIVNSLNNPDSVWSVNLWLSKPILDNNRNWEIPPNPSITILDPINNSVVDVLAFNRQFNGAMFRGTHKPIPDKEYMIKVVTAGYGTSEALATIPPAVAIEKIELDSTNFSFNRNIGLKVYFQDPPKKKNYYELKVFSRSYYVNHLKDTVWSIQQLYIAPDEASSVADFSGERVSVLADTFFDGEYHVISGTIINYGVPATEPRAILYSYSEEYYKYLTTVRLQQNTQGDPFAQPVQVYTNIKNGLGIFAGYSQSMRELGK